jgi:hypothetical protein
MSGKASTLGIHAHGFESVGVDDGGHHRACHNPREEVLA